MDYREFLSRFFAAAVKTATETFIEPDPKSLANFRDQYESLFLHPSLKKIIPLLEADDSCGPEELVSQAMEFIRKRGLVIPPHHSLLEPGEVTKEGLLKRGAAELTVTIEQLCLRGGPQGGPSPIAFNSDLYNDIMEISTVWKQASQRAQGKKSNKPLTPKDEEALREKLSKSLINAEALIQKLKDPTSYGQYL